ncbi:hypothetical protein QFC22_002097 [Naganishia vaughanmartiniae]|uniref:Uncharacterized protein n=1 Tax=Naganishia vaughanmartiniae TaxID=1424756 RepID=A0ACC2XEL7_9TREE|nr:hypothetical protein QFC22_002097 [Naganishia vaughanmartiniae]
MPDDTKPPNWPSSVIYTSRPIISTRFPPEQLQYINRLALPCSTIRSLPPLPLCKHPKDIVRIKLITQAEHPAKGQNGLFTVRKLEGGCKVIDYVGVIHSRTPQGQEHAVVDEHEKSDYDLSLIRCMSVPSSSSSSSPTEPILIDIGIDAAKHGNAARMINDYRGIAAKPNSEFRQVWDPVTGWARMEVWTLPGFGLKKGDEVLVSYGKGFWAARTS